jgi:biotin-(acetyl-CoA carboxylase) ligase
MFVCKGLVQTEIQATNYFIFSLNRAFPNFDGIVVNADTQRAAVGRAGNQWLSPKGSISFSFDFNVPSESELGQNVVFLQHILAVSIVDAVLSLLKLPDFPLRIKVFI